MSNRNWQRSALILSLIETSSSHKMVTCLLPEGEGAILLNATLFGGAKNKMSSVLLPYYTGNLWIYTNPIKEAHKVVDFEATKMRFNIRESLYRIWAASFASEMCVKLKGCVPWFLVNAFLDGINVSNEGECKTGVLRFIWRLASFSGLAPSHFFCDVCNKKHFEALYFDHKSNTFLCEDCCKNKNTLSFLPKEALEYLYMVSFAKPKEARRFELSNEAFSTLRLFLFRFAKEMAYSELYSFSPKNPIYSAIQI